MRTLLLPLGLLLAATAAATGATYKWVDKNGVTHYSDKPVPGAVLIDTGPAQTYTPPPPPPPSTPSTGSAKSAPADSSYKTFEMWRPEPDETFRGTANTVVVRIRMEPALRPGHSIWIYLDGKRVDGLPQTGDSFELKEVWRGTHSVAAVISDGAGKPLMQTPAVTFHMQQVGLNSPTRVKPQPRAGGN